jgi:predicted secreted protein
MLLPIALALLAQPLVGAPRLAVRPGPPEFDPMQMICKYDRALGSRLAQRKVCRTAAEWEEERRSDRGALFRHQYNGAR